jgi:hypothetical protein
MVLQDIGSMSYKKDVLHQIWIVEPEFGKKNLKKVYRIYTQNQRFTFSMYFVNSILQGS